jgi:hypothetical protein
MGISFQLRTAFARGPHSSEEGTGSLYLNQQSLMGISVFDPLILEKSNRLRLELSVQNRSAVCSKRNTSVTARFDSGQIQAGLVDPVTGAVDAAPIIRADWV